MTHAHNPAGRRQFLVWGATSILLAGCGNLLGPSQPPMQIYVLQPPFRRATDMTAVSWQLAIAEPEAPHSFQNARVGLQRGNTFDYYADAQWTDSTPHLIQSLLVQAFEAAGRIEGVAPESAGMHADYILETEIRDFDARYAGGEAPPDVVVVLGARLLSAGRGEVVGTFVAQHTARAAQNTVPAVVDAFSQATGESLDDIVAWTFTAQRANERAGRSQTAR